MEIAIVLGSTRQERKSHGLAWYLQAQLLKNGAAVHLIDLKDQAGGEKHATCRLKIIL